MRLRLTPHGPQALTWNLDLPCWTELAPGRPTALGWFAGRWEKGRRNISTGAWWGGHPTWWVASLSVGEGKDRGRNLCWGAAVICRGAPWGTGSWGPQARAEEGTGGPVTGRGDCGEVPGEEGGGTRRGQELRTISHKERVRREGAGRARDRREALPLVHNPVPMG